MRESILGFAVATADLAREAGLSSTLVAELEQLLEVLDSAEELAWALTDPAVPITARRAIVEELLTGKLDGMAVRLVSYVVGADRSVEAIHNLKWVTRFLSEEGSGRPLSIAAAELVGEDEDESLPGRLALRERFGGYATAVFAQIANSGRLSEIEDELFRFARLVEGSAELRSALTAWEVPYERRSAIAEQLLSGKADHATVLLVTFALRAGQIRDLVGVLDWLVERAAAERNLRVGELRVAVAPSDEQVRRLAASLRRIVGRDVELRTTIDESVIAGMSVTVGDLVIDATVRRRLEQARRSLLAL